tara:strand:- start:39 stop:299 length:261 start_codon:yes stop_codon:yes gene_type:complete
MEEIKIELSKKLPLELIDKILFTHKGLVHPNALIMNKIINDCKQLIYTDSGGWEEFDTFLNCYDKAGKRPNKFTSLEFYRYDLNQW